MTLALCIIARNEAANMAALASQIAGQTLVTGGSVLEVIVVANGCSDATAAAARRAFEGRLAGGAVPVRVHESREAGKARAWNVAVHELISSSARTAIFVDADIDLAHPEVLRQLVDTLAANRDVAAVTGFPVKDIARRPSKSLVDRFSLAASRQTLTPHALNGSLYAARMDVLRKIWLPVPTPGEDGLLSAMIHTDSFARPARPECIVRLSEPSHFFKAHGVAEFFRHERRMTVGTVVNGWICEFFWAAQLGRPAGPTIRDLNANDPQWVHRLVASHCRGRLWVLPRRMLGWRLQALRGLPWPRALRRAPVAAAATLLGLWPAILANATLRRTGAAAYW